MVDLTNFELVDGLMRDGCTLCRQRVRAERWELEMFIRDGRFSREARPSFLAGGGYCKRHAWLLHAQLSEHDNGAPIADLYGMVLRHDRAALRVYREPRRRSRRHRIISPLPRTRCLACENTDAADDRHAYFFMHALQEARVRNLYETSDGLCMPHTLAVLDEALEAEQSKIIRFLIEQTLRRLDDVAESLAEYDRRRDVHYAHLPKGPEQQAWTDVIRIYAGDEFLQQNVTSRRDPPGVSGAA